MDRSHSQLIVLLLAGIFAVLLFGREAVLGSLEGMVWISIAIGIPVLLIWVIVAFVRYLRREARAYREEARRDRDQGLPWLYKFAAWPGIIGNFLVLGVAAYRYFDNSCRFFAGDCLQTIPYWWLPVALLLASIPISAVEQIVVRLRRRNTAD